MLWCAGLKDAGLPIVGSIELATNIQTLKLHAVLSQRTSFVAHHILNLS
jgi:hypothetical protein